MHYSLLQAVVQQPRPETAKIVVEQTHPGIAHAATEQTCPKSAQTAVEQTSPGVQAVLEQMRPKSKFLVPDWGICIVVDSNKGFSYQPASLCSL